MLSDQEQFKMQAELYRVMAAKLDMQYEIERAKANIARLQENIENQKKREDELKALLKI